MSGLGPWPDAYREETPMCEWFALCENEATTTREGPGPEPGTVRQVPICDPCNDKMNRIEAS